MIIGDVVEKIGGDYTFVGTVVSVFPKLSGLIRVVVEDDRGILHIYSEKNLKVVYNKDSNIAITNNRASIINSIADSQLKELQNSRLVLINELLKKFLSANVIIGGTGTIQPDSNYSQFESDINNLSVDRLSTWPSGFYRNLFTKELQLLIVGEKYLFRFDGLPGLEYKLSIGLQIKDDDFRDILAITDADELEGITDSLGFELEYAMANNAFN
jgi:hypothetical protein